MIDRRKNTDFGIILTLVLVVVSAWRGVELTMPVIIILLTTLLIPKIFTPFTWLWFKLGDLLGLVVTRCILFFLFFMIVTPIGYFRRLMNKDPFHLKQFGKGTASLFISHEKTYSTQDLEKQY